MFIVYESDFNITKCAGLNIGSIMRLEWFCPLFDSLLGSFVCSSDHDHRKTT